MQMSKCVIRILRHVVWMNNTDIPCQNHKQAISSFVFYIGTCTCVDLKAGSTPSESAVMSTSVGIAIGGRWGE